MKTVWFTVVLLGMIVIRSGQSTSDSKPRMDPEQEEIVINSGEDLELRCSSTEPIHWKVPIESENYVNTTNTYERDSVYAYISHLSLQKAMYLQTGFYYCTHDDNEDLQNGRKTTAIYVYVKDDANLLALEDNPRPLSVNERDKVIIPCRPTDPNVTVVLLKNSEEITVDGFEVSYDPRIGFTYASPQSLGTETELKCKAKRNSLFSEHNFDIIVSSYSEDIAAPTIQGPQHAIIDSTLELNCSVPYEVGITVDLKWNVPDERGRSTGRIVESPLRQVESRDEDSVAAMRTLTIKKVTTEDEGMYTCTVKDNSQNEKSTEKYIPVLDKGKSYINLTVQTQNITIMAGTPFVQWVVFYTGHPEPQIIWHRPSDTLSKYDVPKTEIETDTKFEIHTDSKSTRLVIKNPSIEDTGEYRLQALNRGTSKEEVFHLNVLGAAEVNVSVDPFYMVNSWAEVVCSVVGNPYPIITWMFKPCSLEPSLKDECEFDDSDTISSELHNEIAFRKVNLQSTLRIRAVSTGRLRCTACNPDCLHKDVNFYVTDVPGGFYVSGPNMTVEGDSVQINCSVSANHYHKDLIWLFNEQPVTGKTTQSSTKISHHSILQVKDADKTNSGVYSCLACRLEDKHPHCINPVKQDFDLIVTAMRPPKIRNSTNLLNDTKEVALKQEFKLRCLADGIPKPKVSWYKEDKEVVLKDNIEILFDSQILEFKYITAEDEGKYTCRAESRAGSVESSITISLLDKPRGVNIGMVIGLLVMLLLILGVIIYLIMRIRSEKRLRHKLTQAGLADFEHGAVENLNLELGVEDQAELLPYDRNFEFPREKLKLGKVLGQGAFGVVMKGDAYGIVYGEPSTPVAVKMVKRNADSDTIKALATELKIMVHLGRHLNVVNLLGACTKSLNKMELLVIVEYCRYGNLHNYLLRHRKVFIDQIDPKTGLIDSSIGEDAMIPSHNQLNGRPRLKYASLSFPNSSQSESIRGENPRDSRSDYRSQSDNSENCVTGATEATFISMSPTGGPEDNSCLMSNNSQQEWRSVYKGDFKGTVSPVKTLDLLCYAFQVARGMDYLASRKVLHGDLAARNILLADNNVVKICDFGLARNMYKDDNYHKTAKSPLPIMWMAIESIRDRVFSTQSDVWSFGIVLWEFFSLSRTPYPGMSPGEVMYQKLEDGYRMDKPVHATDDVYQLMMECWRARPALRPSFADLGDRLGAMLEESVRKHYVDLNEPYVQMNIQRQNEAGHNDYLSMMNAPTYSNVMSPSNAEEKPLYQNELPDISRDGKNPRYLTMKSVSPGDPHSIFSPTRTSSGNVFQFHGTTPQRHSTRDTEQNDHIELRPMLSGGSAPSDSNSGHESDSDIGARYTAVPNSRPVNPTAETLPNEPKSFSNPSYHLTPNIFTSRDEFISNLRNIKEPNINVPTFSTFGRKPVDLMLPVNYSNLPAQRQALALNEAEVEEDPPYLIPITGTPGRAKA